MVEYEARVLASCIKQLCDQQKGGAWVTIIEEHRPDLKAIRLEISIKVEHEGEK